MKLIRGKILYCLRCQLSHIMHIMHIMRETHTSRPDLTLLHTQGHDLTHFGFDLQFEYYDLIIIYSLSILACDQVTDTLIS